MEDVAVAQPKQVIGAKEHQGRSTREKPDLVGEVVAVVISDPERVIENNVQAHAHDGAENVACINQLICDFDFFSIKTIHDHT